MSKSAKQRAAERAESIANLKETIKPGDTIHAVCRKHDRRSGSTQWSFYKLETDKDGKVRSWWLNYHMGRILGYRLSGSDYLCLPFMNMDAAFQVVYTLAFALFGDLPQEEINKHDPRWEVRKNGGKGSAGYLLNKENL